MSEKSRSGLHRGDRVRVRGERWQVDSADVLGNCEALCLVGRDRRNRLVRRIFLHPFDRPRRIGRRSSETAVRPVRWLAALRRLQDDAASWSALHGAAAAGIDLHAYQLEPALQLLAGRASRFLLADEVGLGKTIQAGILVRELWLRGWARRVLAVTPSGLVTQWQAELSRRFGLPAAVMDAMTSRDRTRSLPAGDSPWSPPGLYVASIDFVKRLETRRAIEQTLWDVLVVDEAHLATPQSDRGLAIRALASRSRYVLLISATPHAGRDPAFVWLARLGSLGDDDPLVVVRRTRGEVGRPPRRPAHLLPVRTTDDERRMHDLLEQYATQVWYGARGDERRDARLAMIVLIKRALSSAASLERSVGRRLAWLGPPSFEPGQVDLPLAELDDSDEAPSATLRAPGLSSPRLERARLEAIRHAARRCIGRESKQGCLERLLRRTSEPVIVFTEYRDTQLDLADRLAPDHPCAVLHGGVPLDQRRRVEKEFTAGRTRLLLATDVAGTGLNLQARCRWVVNYELPWNPMRLEQRAGRVDRIGQRRPVHVLHLVATGTAEEHVLAHLAARLDRVRAAVGHVDHILGSITPERLAERALFGAGLPEAAPSRPRLSSRRQSCGPTVAASAECLQLERQRQGASHRRRIALQTPAGDDTSTRYAHLSGHSWPPGLILVFEVVVEDGASTPIGKIPLACLVTTARPVRQAPAHRHAPVDRALVRAVERRVQPVLASIARARAGRLMQDHVGFLGRAIRRERTLLRSLRRSARAPVQATLFDRRAIRRAATERLLLDRLELDSRARLDRLTRTVDGMTLRFTLALVATVGREEA